MAIIPLVSIFDWINGNGNVTVKFKFRLILVSTWVIAATERSEEAEMLIWTVTCVPFGRVRLRTYI